MNAARLETRRAAIRPDWWSKTLAGVLAGFALAFALSGLFAFLTAGGPAAPNKFQVTMWFVAPAWMAALSLCFLFRSGLRAWLWLGGANVVAWAALYLCHRVAA
ncbi:MAG: hypothetical protein WC247_14240 [Porticoccaceae bacterium]|jgi:hypothetical protein